MKIAIGTKSKQKLEYIEEVLHELNVEAELVPVEVKSGVSEQPLTSDETRLGSANRAKEALEKTPEADVAIGIEVGYHPDKEGRYEMFCWTTIVDHDGYSISKGSHKFLLPKFYQQLFKEGKNLGEHAHKYLKDTQKPIERHLSDMFVGRRSFINNAVRHALLIYLNKDEF